MQYTCQCLSFYTDSWVTIQPKENQIDLCHIALLSWTEFAFHPCFATLPDPTIANGEDVLPLLHTKDVNIP